MIPDFTDQGYLPPGIHPATITEIAARFGKGSELRRVQVESLQWLVKLDEAAHREICDGLPFLEIVLFGEADFEYLIHVVFATDRRHISKGIVEVML